MSQPTDVHVAWKTDGRSSTVPEDEVGLTLYSFGDPYGGQTKTWVHGYEGATVVTDTTDHDQPRVCVRLERRTIEYYERFGQEESDYAYSPLSSELCKDIPPNANGTPAALFELSLGH